MDSITEDEFQDLTVSIKRSFVHLETRDAYGTETELPQMAKWRAGEPDDFAWLEDWCQVVRGHIEAGRTARRVKIVSEPLSDYQHWAYEVLTPIAEAGEDIRWLPRREVSAVAIPGNDFYVFDDERVVFLHYTGSGLNTDFTTTTDPAIVEMCRAVFEEVWEPSIPHRDYQPH